MKKINVIYAGWGERFRLGVLADDGKDIMFEYTAEALERGLELSPYKMPLARGGFSGFPEFLFRLPGFISDALPDGWGMLVMDRLFRKEGRELSDVSPLDRLALIGEHAIGPLAFEPAELLLLPATDMQLMNLAKDVRRVFDNDESEIILRKLVLIGGSPHGARPKALVNFDPPTNQIYPSEHKRGVPMLVKFPGQIEHKEVCAIETLYARLATECGISVPRTYFFELDDETSAFGIERFDRHENMRVPVHTASAAAHVDFRMPQIDYVGLLRLTRFITKDVREVRRAFERCVFNVIFNNRDDHPKNFSFLMDKHGRWLLSPAYDLTYNVGPNGLHQMDICGEAKIPGRKNLLELARKTGVEQNAACEAIDRMVGVAQKFGERVGNLPIREQTLRTIEKAIKTNCERMQVSKKPTP
jgi:serine/threonine-protein kinase HipA